MPKRRRPLWMRIVFCVAGVILLGGVSVLALEGYRQMRVRAAMQEFDAEAQGIRAKFAHVTDWDAWHRSRTAPNWGGDKLKELADRLDTEGRLAKDLWHQFEVDLVAEFGPVRLTNLLRKQRTVSVDEQALRDYLRLSQPFADDARELLAYDSLAALADDDGSFPVIRQLGLLQFLMNRVDAHAALEDPGRAWAEWAVCMELFQRIKPGRTLLEQLVFDGCSGVIYGYANTLAGRFGVPDSMVELLPLNHPEVEMESVVHGELAYIAMIYDVGQLKDHFEDVEASSWFWWLRGEDLGEMRQRLFSPDLEISYETEGLRTTRALYRAARDGTEWPEIEGSVRWWHAFRGSGRATLAAIQANLAWRVREARTAGKGPEGFTWDADQYRDVRISVTDDAWVVTWQPADAVKARLWTDLPPQIRRHLEWSELILEVGEFTVWLR
jgi:hypothetical protein